MATMDVQQLNSKEQEAYLSIVDGNDIIIIGNDKKAIIQQSSNKKYDVCDLQNKNVIKSFKYPIDALNNAVKLVGNFNSWQIAY
jgi:hypothetical protein